MAGRYSFLGGIFAAVPGEMLSGIIGEVPGEIFEGMTACAYKTNWTISGHEHRVQGRCQAQEVRFGTRPELIPTESELGNPPALKVGLRY